MQPEFGALWHPSPEYTERSNLAELMRRLKTPTYGDLLELSRSHPERFWMASLEHLDISFDRPPSGFVDLSRGKPWPRFFPDAGFNFAAACLQPPRIGGGSEQAALIWENEAGRSETLSYAELERRTRQFAGGLRNLGVGQGDRVGLLLPNVPEAVIAFLAIGYIGAISVPLYSGYGAEPVAKRLLDAQASCLISADGFMRRGKLIPLTDIAAAAAASVPTLKVLVMADLCDAPKPAVPYVPWADVERHDPIDPARTLSDDPFMVIYTSGTTGRPKGAVHVHAGFPLRVTQDAAYLFDFHPGERLFWMSDMGWMVGPFSIIAALLLKGTLVLYDGAPDVPDYSRLRAIAGRHGVTHFGSAPTAIRAMAANEEITLRAAAPALRVLITAGEVIDPDAFRWYQQRFGSGRLPVINYTGGTEVSGAILSNVILRPIAAGGFNSVAPGMAAGVIDESGKQLKGTPGELAIFSPFVGMTNGFWRDSERYIESYWKRVPDVWVHGDLAIENEDGSFLLVGRSDDVMKIAGKRVGPAEIEASVCDGETIAEALAVGVPDPLSGEALILFVVPGARQLADKALIEHAIALLRREMGPAFKPKAVIAVPRLPKTRNGKPVRRLARQAWLGAPAGDLNAIEDPSVFEELVKASRRHNTAGS